MERVGRLGPPRAVCAAIVAIALAGAGCSTTDDDDSDSGNTTQVATATSGTPMEPDPDQPLSRDEERGQALFVTGCGSCHTLEAAGTTGQVGPDLDELQPDEARVLRAIRVGGQGSGSMPRDIYRDGEARQVARFVAGNAGGS